MWLEKKYISLMSSSLDRFKSTGDNTWNFRCPICSDSKINKTKSRGYLLFGKGKFYSYCHNCHASLPFNIFLKTVNPVLYDDYLREKFAEDPNKKATHLDFKNVLPNITKQKSVENLILMKLKKVSNLKPEHPVKMMVVARMIPSYYHSRLYYANNFNAFANQLVDNKFDPKKGEKRLVIPMLDQQKKLIGIQGRAVTNVDPQYRYMTCLLSPENPRFYGLDLVNFSKKYYMVEGPIDSMFIENCLAVCGGAIHSEIKKFGAFKPTCVVVYDNEPRNKDIIRNMMKVVRMGYKICVWPESVKEKDINEMVLAQVPPANYVQTELVQTAMAYIKNTIDSNIYEGLAAEARISEWSKVT